MRNVVIATIFLSVLVVDAGTPQLFSLELGTQASLSTREKLERVRKYPQTKNAWIIAISDTLLNSSQIEISLPGIMRGGFQVNYLSADNVWKGVGKGKVTRVENSVQF